MNGGPRVVVIGGGTGLSVLLRGLKQFTKNITAIVTMADDGGGSGVLREDLGMLPPGDLRNCILALSNTEPIMERLLQYRFDEGLLKGQCFGNLLIAAMTGISSSFEEAIERVNDIFAVTGKVLPATTAAIDLWAVLENGTQIVGESELPVRALAEASPIHRVGLLPANPPPLEEAVKAVQEADLIVLGPGSLFTSVIPNLLIQGLADAIEASEVPKVYICNLMTQPGETDEFGVWQHVQAILDHTSPRMISAVIVNTGTVPLEIQRKYQQEGAHLITLKASDTEALDRHGIRILQGDFVEIKSHYLRHDATHLSSILLELVGVRRYPGNRNFQLKPDTQKDLLL